MLYGHIETVEERIDHMLRTRALQDETGGLQAFIPLAFHPDNNQMRKLPAPSAIETLRVHAVARLMLDNVPHIKAFWIATGVETRAAGALVRRRRPRRHRPGGDASITWRIAHAGSDDARRHPPSHPCGGPGAVRARHAVQRHRRPAGPTAAMLARSNRPGLV